MSSVTLDRVKMHINRAERKILSNLKTLRLRPDYRRAGEEYWRAATLLKSKGDLLGVLDLTKKSSKCFALANDHLRSGKVLEELVDIAVKSNQEGIFERELIAEFSQISRYIEFCYLKCGQVDGAARVLQKCGHLLISSGIDFEAGVILLEECVTLLETENRPHQGVLSSYNSIKTIFKVKKTGEKNWCLRKLGP